MSTATKGGHDFRHTKKETKMVSQGPMIDKQGQEAPASGQSSDFQRKVEAVRAQFADASQMAKTALENVIRDLESRESAREEVEAGGETAGRIGSREGEVSELTLLFPFSPDAAKRLRAVLKILPGLPGEGADLVGTVHDMRFVLLDNDTKLLFATAYDGDWDPYVDDFATKVPDYLDLQFSGVPGWPGIRSPAVKDFLVQHQVQAQGWYVATPNLTVAGTRRLERVGMALDEFLDKIDKIST